jgi:hypothetical protein
VGFPLLVKDCIEFKGFLELQILRFSICFTAATCVFTKVELAMSLVNACFE